MEPTTPIRLAAVAMLALAAGCGEPAGPAALPGYAEAELVYVAPPAAGTLQAVRVHRGERVARGQTLFTLDADAQGLALDAAEARLAGAQARRADLQKGRRADEIRAVDAQLAQARATLAASSDALERSRALVAQGFVAPQQLEGLSAARERDAARVRELQAQRAVALAASRPDQIAAASAETRAGSADPALVRWQQSQRERAAPVDALVHDVMFRAGEWVSAGAPVVALMPPGAVKLRFFVPEPLLARIGVGQRVQVACDGCPAGLTARVRYVSPQAEFTPPVIYSPGARSKLVFLVEAVPADGAGLKPGQPVDVRLEPAG